MKMIQKLQPKFKIYRDGQVDLRATWKPIITKRVVAFGRKVDYFFVNSRWPKIELE